jgi:hypothetical protein
MWPVRGARDRNWRYIATVWSHGARIVCGRAPDRAWLDARFDIRGYPHIALLFTAFCPYNTAEPASGTELFRTPLAMQNVGAGGMRAL